LETIAITNLDILPSFIHPGIERISKGKIKEPWSGDDTTQLSHDSFNVIFDLVVSSNEYIEAVFFHDFEVFGRVDSSLVKHTLEKMQLAFDWL
jgi:hypothetical protein